MTTYITQHLHRAIRHKPNHLATVFGDRRKTYGELGVRVSKLAGGLKAIGVKPGDRVGILAMNSDRYLEVFLATFWAGGVINPVNTRWSEKEILFSLDDCSTEILIVDETFKEFGGRLINTSKTLRKLIYAGDNSPPPGMLDYETLIRDSEPVEDAYREGSDLAGIFYTGGTTGFPKGVMLSHDSINAAMVNRLSVSCGPGPRALHVAPLFHLAACLAMWSQLAIGETHVFLPSFDALSVMEIIQREEVTDTLIVPTMIQMILDHPKREEFNLLSLKHIIYGASPISETLLNRFMDALPKTLLIQGYGMTELSGCVSFLPPDCHTKEGRLGGKLKSAGFAAILSEVAIVDNAGKELPRGEVGEIVARSATAMLGYWNRPEETASTLRNGWLHTGDMAYMDAEGFIFVVDRLKDMIVSGGENVYSAEVENAIMKHPSVSQCAVIGIPNDQWGESVHAAVVLKPGCQLTFEELVDHCRSLIAGYKCPRSIEFKNELPISATGKLQKHRLRENFWKQGERRVN